MKKIIAFIILLFSLSVFGSCESNNEKFEFDNLKELKGSFIIDLNEYYNEQGKPDFNINTLVHIGKYGDGYLFAFCALSIIDIYRYKDFVIDNVTVRTCYEVELYYYYEFDIYEGLDNIYNHKFLNKKDLLDINSKFAEYKAYYYVIFADYEFEK